MHNHNRPIATKLLLVLAIAISVIFTFWSIRWIQASLFYKKGIAEVASVVKTQDNDTAHWEVAIGLLQESIRLNPIRAEYYSRMAIASYVRSKGGRQPLPADQQQEYYINALHNLDLALQHRPYSGFYWSDIAKYLYASASEVPALLNAVDKMLVFAGHQPFIIALALKISFEHWSELDNDRRQKLHSAMRYLHHHDATFAIRSAVSNGWGERLQPILFDKEQLALFNKLFTQQNTATQE